MVLLLEEDVDKIFGEEQEVASTVAIQIAGAHRVGRELAVFNRPAARVAPTISALVVPVIHNVRAPVSIQVSNHQ